MSGPVIVAGTVRIAPVDAEGMSKGVFALSPSAFRMSGQIESFAIGSTPMVVDDVCLTQNAL